MSNRRQRPIDEAPNATCTTLIRVDPVENHGLARVEVFIALDDQAKLSHETCVAHVQLPLPPARARWDAEIAIEVHDGEGVVASVHIASILGVPKGGLRMKDLRPLALNEIKKAALTAVRDPEIDIPLATRSALVAKGVRAPGRRADEIRLARLADLYVRAASMRGPVYENMTVLARAEGFGDLDREQLRNEVERARSKLILSRPGAGRRTSELTARGRELLNQQRRRTALRRGKTLADDDSEMP